MFKEIQNINSFNYIGNENLKLSKNYNDTACDLNEDADIISNYIENMLKSSDKDYFGIKRDIEINDEQKNNIKLMVKMTLNINYTKDD